MKQVLSRRMRTPILSILLLAGTSPASAQQQIPQAERPLVSEVEAVRMTVADITRSSDFYLHVLSFKKLSEENVPGAEARSVRLKLGNGVVELKQYSAGNGRPVPADSKSNDLWFQHLAIVVSDMPKAYERLQRNGVHAISAGPQRLPRWNQQAADIEAFYFMDPDAHPLELIRFPEGKGDPQWHRKTSQLFLGIDHTAIAASSTAASLAFYRSVGFEERGHSLNYGVEQERLSGVTGARVRITGLRVRSGPGIEILEYENPRTGRAMPADERATDLLHHETILLTSKLNRVIETLCTARVTFVSAEEICNRPAQSISRRSVLVRDPDGHVMELVER